MDFVTRIKNFLKENQVLSKSIFKNTAWLFSGQFFGRLLRVTIVVYAARILGPASWGAFSYALSLVAFLTIFTDVGVSAIVTKESARNPELSSQYFSTAFFIKLVLLFIGVIGLLFLGPLITNIQEAKTLMPIIAWVLIFDSLRNFGFSLSRAQEKMRWEGVNEIVTNFFITVLGFIFLWKSPSSQSLTISYALATAVGFLLIAWKLRSYFFNLIAHFNKALIKPILDMAWPFALASSLGAIMINTDTLMVGWFRSAAEVGFYSAAQRPIQMLYILPTLVAASLFPTFARLAHQDKTKYREILENYLRIMILAAAPITFFGIIFGSQIIWLLFGPAYQSATATFQILLLTILIIFPSAIINNSIFAHDKQKNFIAFSALGALGNALFNLLLIPIWGIAGCAVSTVITQLIANAFMWKKLKSITDFKIF